MTKNASTQQLLNCIKNKMLSVKLARSKTSTFQTFVLMHTLSVIHANVDTFGFK